MTDEWHWDDESIAAPEELYRHVPRKPNQRKRVDPTTGEWSLTAAAFTTDEMQEDGWSIYRNGLMYQHGLTQADIESSGDEPREVWGFQVVDVRDVDGCGVIDQEDPAGGMLGRAHGLVRCSEPKPEKKKIVTLRNNLINRATPR